MVKTKTKPLMPSLREKKRYLVYEAISKTKFDAVEINNAIFNNAKEFLGNLGMAKAGILMLNDKWNKEIQKGILRVNNKHLDEIRASLVFLKDVNGKEALVRSIGASGILKKANDRYVK